MANLRTALCCSHAPGLIRSGGDNSPARVRLEAAYDQAAAQLASLRLDFLVVIVDDHFDNYFLNSMPTFSLGANDRYDTADEGIGGYWSGQFRGHEGASTALGRGLVERGFDLAISYGDMALDHAATIPIPRLFGANPPPVVPLIVNCVWPPIPSARRCWQLGRAIAEVLQSWGEDLNYGLIGSGGLSHQLSGQDFGTINEAFDRSFLARVCGERRSELADLTEEDLRQGGEGALELLNWIVVAGAVGDDLEASVLGYEPLPSAVTGMGIVRYDLPALSGRSNLADAASAVALGTGTGTA